MLASHVGGKAGSGGNAAVEADSVQIGQWAVGLTGAPAAPSSPAPLSWDTQSTKNEPE